jgi:hypothetical protein
MKIYSNVRQVLGTVQPHDGKVGLRCSVADAERTWYDYIGFNDRKNFELVVERAPHGCNVSVRPWGDDDFEAPNWVRWVIVAVFAVAIAGVSYVRFY